MEESVRLLLKKQHPVKRQPHSATILKRWRGEESPSVYGGEDVKVLPLVIGMTIRHYFPLLAKSLEPITNRLAVIFLAVIICLLIIRESERLPLFIAQAGIAVIILHTIASLIGFFSGRLFQLTIPQRICIAIEVGIQSGTLAIAITAGLLKNPDLAIPAIVYSLWMYASAFIAVYYGRKKAALAK